MTFGAFARFQSGDKLRGSDRGSRSHPNVHRETSIRVRLGAVEGLFERGSSPCPLARIRRNWGTVVRPGVRSKPPLGWRVCLLVCACVYSCPDLSLSFVCPDLHNLRPPVPTSGREEPTAIFSLDRGCLSRSKCVCGDQKPRGLACCSFPRPSIAHDRVPV
jgi:hypothetical protein